jgi:superfamily II DNA or RNA helicase
MENNLLNDSESPFKYNKTRKVKRIPSDSKSSSLKKIKYRSSSSKDSNFPINIKSKKNKKLNKKTKNNKQNMDKSINYDSELMFLSKINESDKKIIIKKCIQYLQERKGNRYIQKKIMRHYNLDDNGSILTPPKKTEKDARTLLSKFDVSLTGCRVNDIIEGCVSTTKGSIIKIYDNSDSNMIKIKRNYNTNNLEDFLLYPNEISNQVYPEKGHLDIIRKYPEIWNDFLQKLGCIPFFNKMNIKARELWLFINEDNTHNYTIIGFNNLLQVLQPGNFSSKLDEIQLQTLITGNENNPQNLWTGKEIEDFFPKAPGSKAVKHTLALIRSFWKISNTYEIVSQYDGEIINLPYKGNIIDPSIYILKDILISKKKYGDIGIRVSNSNTNYESSNSNFKLLYDTFNNLPPSFYKSLIQKIIRFRPLQITFPDFLKIGKHMDSNEVLTILIVLLIQNPGSFVPDIQRYVTGKESCFKRLGVCIMEDSFGNENNVATLFTSAFLSQRVKSWNPNSIFYNIAIDSAIESLNTNKYFNYDIKRGSKLKPHFLNSNQSAKERSSALIDEIKSFACDQDLVRDSVSCEIKNGFEYRPQFMDLEHSVDHHWGTGLTYYFDIDSINEICNKSNSNTFQPFFKMVWEQNSALNPRKTNFLNDEFIQNDFIKKLRKAQRLYLLSQLGKQKKRGIIDGKYEINIQLNDGWLASLIGTIEVGGSPSSIVTMNADNISELIAIRRPSRDVSAEPLTEEQKTIAITKAKQILEKGILLNSATSPIPVLKGSKIKLINEEYKIIKGKEIYNWSDFVSNKITFPLHSKMNLTLENNLTHVGIGVEIGCDDSLIQLIEDTELKILRRVLYYLAGYNSYFQMNRISRNGGGIVQSVVIEDIGAYQFFLKLSGYYPGAFELIIGNQCKFKVKSIALLLHIKTKMKTILYSKRNILEFKWSAEIKDKKKRILWDHQEQLLKEMTNKFNSGDIGTFLWLRVGMGKTLIVMKYIEWLIQNKQLPPYVIYSLPESALKSVLEEIHLFDLPIRIMIPLKDIPKSYKFPSYVEITQDCNPEPNKINIITSDNNLRKCEESLIKIADDSLFIVDEVHKTMNDSKRTNVALNIASLAKDFVVFTGTPVIDSKTYKLIAWLKMIVPYEVNDKNYLVSANSMLTRNVNTGVKITREKVEAPFNKDEIEEYNKLIPLALGGTNTNPGHEQMAKASEICYNVCNREMVKQVLLLIKEKKNPMVVAKDTKHQILIKEMLIEKNIKEKDIFVLSSGNSIVLTDDSVKKDGIDYKVVIVPIRRPEGYTLTRLKSMVTSIYPSNQATRTQIEGRINRIGQKETNIIYKIVHAGILTNIMNNHDDAKSLEIALMKMSKNIK